MACGAFADRNRSVLEHIRAALIGVAIEARRFAGAREAQAVSAGTPVRLVTRVAFHSAAPEAVRIRLISEGCDLGGVAVGAKSQFIRGEEMLAVCVAIVDRVACQAVDGNRIRVHAAASRNAIRRSVMADHAGLVGAFQSGRLEDFRLIAAAFDVLFARTMARLAQ